jgi:hypothetical protein
VSVYAELSDDVDQGWVLRRPRRDDPGRSAYWAGPGAGYGRVFVALDDREMPPAVFPTQKALRDAWFYVWTKDLKAQRVKDARASRAT